MVDDGRSSTAGSSMITSLGSVVDVEGDTVVDVVGQGQRGISSFGGRIRTGITRVIPTAQLAPSFLSCMVRWSVIRPSGPRKQE